MQTATICNLAPPSAPHVISGSTLEVPHLSTRVRARARAKETRACVVASRVTRACGAVENESQVGGKVGRFGVFGALWIKFVGHVQTLACKGFMVEN